MENNRQDEIEIDLLEIVFLFKRKLWILLLAAVVFAGATGLFTKYLVQPLYSSTAKLYILTSSTSITSLADIQVGTSLTKDYVQLVQSRPVVEQVITNLKLNRSYEELLRQMSFSNPSDSRILVITAEDPNPVLAKDIVDQFVEVAKVSISSIMKTDEPSIVELGYIKDEPVSPNMKKNVLIGGALGLFLAAAVIFVLYMIDDTVKSPEDIEKYLGLNTLAAIPLREEEKKPRKKVKKEKGGSSHGK